ncbi:hypothetical protein D3C71_1740230 [compost metagenome]
MQRKLAGPTSLGADLPAFPKSGGSHRSFVLVREIDGHPIPKQRYRITRANGQVIEGISNDKGETAITDFDGFETMKIEFLRTRHA